MLTSRLIKNNPEGIVKYHSGENKYYYKQRPADKDPTTPGPLEWIKVYGNLCPDLGLKPGQSIDETTFTNLLQGRNVKGEKVTMKHKVHGIYLTFSAPKTVSIAGLVTDRNPTITQAHDEAVFETMKEIESKHSYVRPSSTTRIKTNKMVWVTVRNGLSDCLDPHLHTHAILMNICKGPKLTDKIMGMYTKEILVFGFNKAWGAVYRNKLAGKLKEAGYSISNTEKGMWRLDNINQNIENEFSQRQKEIEKVKNKEYTYLHTWRITRKNKQPNYTSEEIQSIWNKRLSGITRNILKSR